MVTMSEITPTGLPELYTEEQLKALEQSGTHEGLGDGDTDMTDPEFEFDTPTKVDKGKAPISKTIGGGLKSHPLSSLTVDGAVSVQLPKALAKRVALAMVGGVESDVTADVLEYVSTLSAKEANEWLFEARLASQSKVQATATDANALADAVRQQSLAASVQRPQLFTGKQEWSVWLNSLLPWLTLQAVKNDHEAISLTLSFIKQDALSYCKNTALGQKYHQALMDPTMEVDDISWEMFSETMAGVPTDIFHTPQSLRCDLNALKSGGNFRAFQAKVDSLMAR